MRALLTFLTVLTLAAMASAQGLELSAGDSTLMGAAGGEVRVVFPTSETDLAGGVVNGKTVVGGTEIFKYRGWTLSGGITPIPFTLQSDFQDGTMNFPAVGVKASHEETDTSLTVFAGATANSYILPFLFASVPDTPTVGVWWSKKLSDELRFYTADTVSGKATAIQTLVWKPLGGLSLVGAAGMGANAPFAAGRIGYKDQHWQGVVNYTKRADDFHRLVTTYTTTENGGLNVMGGFTSAHFGVNADRTSNLSLVGQTVIESTVSSFNTSGSLSIFRINASDFTGESAGRRIGGHSLSGGIVVGPVTATESWYQAEKTTTSSLAVTERVSRHLSLNQFVEGHSVNVGGAWISNRWSASAGEGLSYYPVLGRFVKTESATFSIQIGGTRLNASTVTLPNATTKFSAWGSTYGQGGLNGQLAQPSVSGKYAYTGHFIDQDGQPVAGAVVIGKTEVYGNTKGEFSLPCRKIKTVGMRVVPEDFPAIGRFIIVSAPADITPDQPAIITVRAQ